MVEPGEIQDPYQRIQDNYPSVRGLQGFPQQKKRYPSQQFGGGFQNPNRRPNSNRFLGPTNQVKKPPKLSAADWSCTACQNINFGRRISCNICNMPKPYFEILKTPISQLGPQGLFKDTDWQCFNCRNVNFQKRPFCNMCGEPKPEEYIIREITSNVPQAKKKNKKKKKKNPNAAAVQGNPMNQPNYGNSKFGNFNTQSLGRMQGGLPYQFQQKRYPNFSGGQNLSNRVPFNQRPVQRSRSRSFLKQ